MAQGYTLLYFKENEDKGSTKHPWDLFFDTFSSEHNPRFYHFLTFFVYT